MASSAELEFEDVPAVPAPKKRAKAKAKAKAQGKAQASGAPGSELAVFADKCFCFSCEERPKPHCPFCRMVYDK